VTGDKPVTELKKLPIKLPSVVLFPVISGFADVLQQTPLELIAEPPSSLILPPLLAVEAVIFAAEIVNITGAFTLFFLHPEKTISDKKNKN